MARKLGYVISALILLGAGTATQAAADEYFTLNNQTRSIYITLLVDGRRACATPPGDRCTTLVSRGMHTFTARGDKGQQVVRRETINGPKTWTISQSD